MRKLAIALAAVIGMSSAAHADWNGPRHGHYPRHHYPRHHYHGGGDAGLALFGGLVGGLIIGGMIGQNQGYYQQPRYYQPMCQRVYAGSFWNGWTWVQQYQTICQ